MAYKRQHAGVYSIAPGGQHGSPGKSIPCSVVLGRGGKMVFQRLCAHSGHLTVMAIVLSLAVPANASLMVTPAGATLGFSLTNFVTGFGVSGFGVGPLGMSVNSDGNVIVDASNLSA